MPGQRSGFIKPPSQKIKENKIGGLTQLTYPEDLGAYGFIMNFQEYSYTVDNAQPLKIDTKESIILPLPEKLGQDYAANIKDEELNPLGQLIATTVANDFEVPNDGTLVGGVEQAAGSAGKAFNDVIGDANKIFDDPAKTGSGIFRGLNLAAQQLKKRIAPDFVVSAVEAGAGNIYNPANISAFKGTPVRKHKLNWKLVPRNKSESAKLTQIIQLIRRKMHSQLAGLDGEGEFLQEYPDIISCALITPDINNSIFYKPGLISKFNVDHTGQSGLNFFQGTGSPVEYNLNLEFSELDFITRDDFDEIDVEETNTNSGAGGSSSGFGGGGFF